ncbi:MAG: vWA domain-containing protein [Rhodococcus sp. (in: high G+C Gram-positive bacteria)]
MRRKPKQLVDEPTLFQPGSGGSILIATGKRGRNNPAGENTGSTPGFTEEPAETTALLDVSEETSADSETRRRARRIASKLAVRPPRPHPRARRGIGDLMSLRYRGGSDEIDIDRTVEVLAANPVIEEDHIVVRDRLYVKRSIVLLVDVSGSMKGERVRTAAATVGAVIGEMNRDDTAVVAFWSDAAVLCRFDEQLGAVGVLDALLTVPARGLTNVHFALQTAAELLRTVNRQNSRVLLLSDCVHNAGPDPRSVAARIPRLDVLLDISGENDPELGRDLARLGHGRLRTVRTYREVAPALSICFDD